MPLKGQYFLKNLFESRKKSNKEENQPSFIPVTQVPLKQVELDYNQDSEANSQKRLSLASALIETKYKALTASRKPSSNYSSYNLVPVDAIRAKIVANKIQVPITNFDMDITQMKFSED